MDVNVTFRRAGEADWPAIAALLTAGALPLAGAREHLDRFMVGIGQGKVLCVAGLERYGSVGLLRSVAVATDARRQGLGERLLDAMRSMARSEGVDTLYLLTTSAAAWFSKRGFRPTERSMAPLVLKASREFQGVCPASATLMMAAVAPSQLPVAVLGAGPVGLAAAAHLLARGFTPLLFEQGATPAANLNSYRHVRLFSPWQYNIDQEARRLLAAAGWQAPEDAALPTAGEVIDAYLRPLAALPELAQHVHYAHRVIQVTRAGFDKVKTHGRAGAPFIVRTLSAAGEQDHQVQAVIDATGTWSQPNPLGADGLPALGELAAASHIDYGMPDVMGDARALYAGRRVLVVGAGHSAAGSLLALAQLAEQAPGTQILWAIRGSQLAKVFGGGAADGLPARGQLGARLKALQESGRLELHSGFRIKAVSVENGSLTVAGTGPDGVTRFITGIARIIASTGARPNLDLTRELRVRHDPWLESTDALAPLIDPNEHSCGTVRPHGHRELAHPEPGYYAVGAKSYGRAPNFLMATGYEQVRSVVAALAGDFAAADDVRLELPATGVCNTQFAPDADDAAASCATSSACRPRQAAAAGCCG